MNISTPPPSILHNDYLLQTNMLWAGALIGERWRISIPLRRARCGCTPAISSSFNKESVVLHEVGHCLSLGHRINCNDSLKGIMYNGYTGITQLNARDIQLINSRYP